MTRLKKNTKQHPEQKPSVIIEFTDEEPTPAQREAWNEFWKRVTHRVLGVIKPANRRTIENDSEESQ